MKKIIYTLLLACFAVSVANAQSSLSLEVSQLYSSFKFKDAQGTVLNTEYLGVFTGAYGVGYRYLSDFGLIIKPGIGMRNGGADMVYDDMNYSWQLKYADAKLGIGYQYSFGKVKPYFVASGYYAYLLHGTQVINNEYLNMAESELLNKSDYGVIFSPGVELNFSHYLSGFVEFNYLWGLNNIEMDAAQNSTNFAYGLTLGLSFSFTKK